MIKNREIKEQIKKYNFEKIFIGGKWIDSQSKEWIEVENPATGQIFARVPAGNQADVDLAVEAASASFGAWWQKTPIERKEVLSKGLEIFQTRLDDVAKLETLELGAPVEWAEKAHAMGPMKRYQHFIKVFDDFHFVEELKRSKLMREPVGIVACLTPWNYPLEQIIQKIIPAMLTGNGVILKPSQITPLSAYVLCQCLDEAGLPAGVLNMVTGRGGEVGNFLCTHPKVDMISFTGSTDGGKAVGKLAMDSIKKIALELGGKSAMVVLEGADYDLAVNTAMASSFYNTGQTCSALTRIIVPSKRLKQIGAIVLANYNQYTIGDPFDDGVNIGPLSGPKQFNRVKKYIELGVKEGATILVGGQLGDLGQGGYFVEPTVFTEVDRSMTIAREEIFGPVLSIIPYETEQEAIEIANDTIYGLDGAVFGEEEAAYRVARLMRTGRVNINGGKWDPSAPFGGYKQSGLGREGGKYGLEEFVELKTILDQR